MSMETVAVQSAQPKPTRFLEKATQEGRMKILGMWIYLASDVVLFATFFGAYLALRNHTNYGPTGQDLFDLRLSFLATAILLTSSLTSVLAIVNMHKGKSRTMNRWFLVTALLGYSFLVLEIYEFYHYVQMGLGFTTSAFGSSFYSLLGLHGAHVVFGASWIMALVIRNWRREVDSYTAPKYYLASLYWHFVDVIWVFIFTLVYLLGKVG